jgi:agmatinase
MARVRELIPAVSVGIRSYCSEEAQAIKDKYSNMVFGPVLQKGDVAKILSCIKSKYVYITFDVDGLDPSIMPATGTPEPGGLMWHETLSLLKEICKDKEVVGADIVELAPIKGEVHSDFACAKLAYKMLGYCLL